MLRNRMSPATIRRRLAACAAIAFLLFATSLGLWHRHAPGSPDSENTCQICHVAHHQALVAPEVSTSLSQPLIFSEEVSFVPPALISDPVTLHESPRAPPAA